MGVKLHWHPHPVHNLVYSMSGLLFSGGEEGTVVTWWPSSVCPSFIPRVCSVIVGLCVSADSSHLFVAGSDNSIRFVEATQRTIQASLSGLALAGSSTIYRLENSVRFGIVFDARQQYLIFNTTSHLGQVQVYDPAIDQSVSLLGDTRVDVSKTRQDDKKGTFRVDFVRISTNGEWLFMAERWSDVEKIELPLLRFWKRNPSGGWEFFASIERPHHAMITSMAVHPRRNELITGDQSGIMKVWELVKVGSEKDGNEAVSVDKEFTWSCTYQSKICEDLIRSIAYSQDGSVIALAHDLAVSLFDSESKDCLIMLPSPPSVTPVEIAVTHHM